MPTAFKNGAPGQKECDEALQVVGDHIAMLDVAISMAQTGALKEDDGPDYDVMSRAPRARLQVGRLRTSRC